MIKNIRLKNITSGVIVILMSLNAQAYTGGNVTVGLRTHKGTVSNSNQRTVLARSNSYSEQLDIGMHQSVRNIHFNELHKTSSNAQILLHTDKSMKSNRKRVRQLNMQNTTEKLSGGEVVGVVGVGIFCFGGGLLSEGTDAGTSLAVMGVGAGVALLGVMVEALSGRI